MTPETQASILLVDNDELLLDSITVRLRGDDHRVLSVVNSMQALAVFRSEAVDLVIADINMPGLDGIGLAEDIRRVAAVPIILITAYPNDYEACIGHLSGVELFSKPFSWKDVRARIQSLLGEQAGRLGQESASRIPPR